MTVELISRLAYETARHVIQSGAAGQIEENDKGRPALRLKNLLNSEVEQFLSIWSRSAETDGLSQVRVVIARDSNVVCDNRFLAELDRSITWYRNNNESGLLYVQTKVESDEQGLESMFTIQDRNYLDGSLTTASFKPEQRLVELAWEAAGSTAAIMPAGLPNRLIRVREYLQDARVSISVRMFAAFALKAAEAIRAGKAAAADDASLTRAVGAALPALGLFADQNWDIESSPSRRLLLNYRLAEFMNPAGVDQEPESLVELIRTTKFVNENGNAYDEVAAEEWRAACSDYVESKSDQAREAVPFEIYRQIFSKAAVTGIPLGDRVKEEIQNRNPTRLSEFNQLGVQEGLNAKEQDSARRLLEATVQAEAGPLIDVLSIQTQKLLRKLAYPRDRHFQDPFTTIVEILRSFEPSELAGAELEVRCSRLTEAGPSLGLFAFLYGATLREVIDASLLAVDGVRLTVDDALLTVLAAPEIGSIVADTEDEGAGAAAIPATWEGVPVEVRLWKTENGERRLLDETTNLRWRPDDIEWLAFGWLMMSATDAIDSGSLLEYNSAEFSLLVSEVVARLEPITSLLSTYPLDARGTADGTVTALRNLRDEFFQNASSGGLSVSEIERYVSQWQILLSNARQTFVPNGVLDTRLQAVLSQDIIHSTVHSRALMLFSHPLRLRWLGAYLQEASRICTDALAQQLRLNSLNDSYYLDSFEQLSPHGQPPMLANSARTLLVPVSEHGFSELYAAIKREGQVTTLWRSELDDAALTEIARQVEEYLRAHPHKRDGVSLLFTLPAGGSVPRRLVQMLRRGEWKDLPIRCHVLAPRSAWESVVESFQELETENRISDGSRLNPPLQLLLVEWQSEVEAARQLSNLQFDVAIIPNFFGDKVDVNEYADFPPDQVGSFHTLYDDPTYIDREAAAGSVSIVLKPEAADPVLDDWSTANVRLLRSEAISPQSPEWIDYVKLRIRFEEAAPLFSALHECTHWVITLDRYVGRDQIESLPQRPDVLTVRERVGQSGLSTLVVSSNAGKAFVVQRLGRKLERISRSICGLDWRALAVRIYDEIRQVAPGLILRSMGLSRVTEEVLGLMVAKRIAERELACNEPNARSIWISLDEHADWFGGDSNVRADLCRLDLYRVEDRLKIGIVVVEGKLRQSYDPHGERQARQTAQLLSEALQPVADNGSLPSADALFWRRSILAALRSAGERSLAYETSNGGAVVGAILDGTAWEDLRSGEYDVVYCRALYSICQYDRHMPVGHEEVDGVIVYRSAASEVLALIGAVDVENCEDEGASSAVTMEALTFASGPSAAESHSEQGPSSPEIPAVMPDRAPAQPRSGGMSETSKLGMYQTILDTLAEFGVQVHAPDDGKPAVIEGPAFVQFRVKPDRGVDPKRISERESSLRLSLGLEEGKLLRFSIGGGTVNIDVPKVDEDRYFVIAEEMWESWTGAGASANRLAVPIGENQRGQIVELNFSSANSPHLLIGGATGSGKSEALNTILHGLTRFYTPEQLKLVLIDPKQTELLSFEQSPHLLGAIGFFDDDAIACLEAAVAEMQRRYQLFREKGVRSLTDYNQVVDRAQHLPWQLIVLDEYADLVSEPDVRKQIEGAVKRLSQKARACGIHLIIATQKPSAENISTTVRSNLPAQLALRCRGAAESRVVMDEAGAETLNGKGDAFLKLADRIERVQCALVTQPS